MPDDRFYWRVFDETQRIYIGDPIAGETLSDAYDAYRKASVLLSRDAAMNPNHKYRFEKQPKAKYGWMITRDHLWEDSRLEGSRFDPDEQPETGIIGPRGISPEFNEMLEYYKAQLLVAKVTPKRIHGQKTFKMFDDDGILYYTGIALGNVNGHEPLHDFGGPNAGCTLIKWPRYPDMTAEY